MEMTLEEVDAQLVALRSARTQRLIGGVKTKISYSNGSVEKSVGSLEDINMEIARLEIVRARLAGTGSVGGPIRVGFGSRM
jgi:hypothetical protein